MLFKKKNNDTNMITDKEVNVPNEDQPEKSKLSFKLPFSKKKEDNLETTPENNVQNDTNNEFNNVQNNNTNNNQSNVDFNTDFIKNNHPEKSKVKKIVGLVCDIIIIALVGYFVIWSAPKIVNWFTGGRERYVELAKSMANQIENGYTQHGQRCTSNVNHRFFYNITNSKEQFGDDFVSPINKQPMEGYVEFESYKSGYTAYITLSDGFFGINHVELKNLSKSDIKIFTFLGLDNYPNMECNKSIVISRK